MSFFRSEELLFEGDSEGFLKTHGVKTFADFMSFTGGETITQKRGRSVIRFQLAGRTFFLKRNRFHPGELLKTLLRFRLPPRSGRQEWDGIHAVREAGISTVPPVAMGEKLICGVENASFTLTEELYDAEPLEDVLSRDFPFGLSPALRRKKRDLIRRVAYIARTLHSSGLYHQDLYLGHFFLGIDDSLYLIDLQRIVRRRKVPRRYLIKDLAQMAYSAEVTGGVSRCDQMRFFLTYSKISSLGAAEKALLRKVLAKRRRIRCHTVKLLERRRRRGEIS